MISFVHIGDIHLGLQFNFALSHKKAMDRRRELWSSFERVVEYSRDEDKDFLFIAGDLFEEKYFTLGDMKRVSDILKTIGQVNVVIVAGNHDFLHKDSLYNKVSWGENVTIFNKEGLDKKIYRDLNTVVYGYSWDKVEIKDNKIFDSLEDDHQTMNKILVIHGDINKESRYLPLNISELERLNMDYIALGHIHKPEKIKENIVYCGSLEPLDFGELGPRGFFQGQIHDRETKSEFVAFSKREFKEVEINLNENMGYPDIVKELMSIEEDSRGKDFHRIILKGYIDKDISIKNLDHDLEDDFYHLEIRDTTIPDYDLESMEIEYKYTILGEFISTMKAMGLENKNIKDALYYGLDALLKENVDL